ncbi:hypothetical protein MMC16_002309 [Acarospora aff. strigata]|nr:hypothetical protein [Acarospora aff. strigata]
METGRGQGGKKGRKPTISKLTPLLRTMGYTNLASLMGKNPEVAIFRRFSALNAKNLLYLQAELVNLEARLQRYAADSANSRNGVYEIDWFALSRSEKDGDRRQWDTFLEIRAKLKEYNDALCQQVMTSGFGKPNRRDLDFLRTWQQKAKAEKLFLIGQDHDVWESSDDLIALQPRKESDFFSQWLTGAFVYWLYRKVVFKDPEKGASPVNINPSSASQLEDEYIRVSDSKLLRTADLITTVISSVLPIASVIILYFVHSKLARLGVVAGFTALFSLTLGTMTASRRVEIFAATAA